MLRRTFIFLTESPYLFETNIRTFTHTAKAKTSQIDKYFNQNKVLLKRIAQQPIVHEIKNGSLPINNFLYFLSQDLAFLHFFHKALTNIIDNLTHNQSTLSYTELSTILDVCNKLNNSSHKIHYHYLDENFFHQATHTTRFCQNYGHFLEDNSKLSNIEALTPIATCCLTYQILANQLLKQTSQYNPYYKWISYNASHSVHTKNRELKNALDILYRHATPHQKTKAYNTFLITLHYENLFFKSVYNPTIYTTKPCLVK